MVMSPISYLLLFVFLIIEGGALIGQTSISGRTEQELYNHEIYLLRYNDLLSEHWQVLDQTTIGEDGTFHFQPTLQQMEVMLLQTGSYYAQFFVQPDHDYDIQLNTSDVSRPRTFTAIPLVLEFETIGQDDINSLLPALMKDIQEVQDESLFELIKHLGKGSGAWKRIHKEELSDLNIISEKGDTVVHAFSLDSLHIRIEQLKEKWQQLLAHVSPEIQRPLLAVFGSLEATSGIPLSEVYSEHFDSKSMVICDPLLEPLFEQIIGMAISREDGATERYNQALATADRSAIDGYFDEDLSFIHPRLLPLALLSLVKQQWQSTTKVQRGSLRLLDDLATDESIELDYRKAASSLRTELTAGSVFRTNFLPSITLIDHRRERFDLDALKGQIVYFSVVDINSMSCQRELAVMEGLSRKFGRQIHLVTLCMSNSPQEVRDYLANHPKQDWTFLLGGGHPALRRDLQLYSVPSFYLIEPSGKLHDDHTTSPSEGVEYLFNQLLR